MQHILTDKEYQKLKQKINDLKKHNKALQAKLNDDNKETKTAQEMFEELGLYRVSYSTGVRDEFTPTLIKFRHKLERVVSVDFYLDSKIINCSAPDLSVVKFKMLQKAINKQIEELGWV